LRLTEIKGIRPGIFGSALGIAPREGECHDQGIQQP
jgi:hypothetical protein